MVKADLKRVNEYGKERKKERGAGKISNSPLSMSMKSTFPRPEAFQPPWMQMRFYLALLGVLVLGWFISAFFIALSPKELVLMAIWPLRGLRSVTSYVTRCIVSDVLIQQFKRILPLRAFITKLNLGFCDEDIDELEAGLALYLFLEGVCFYVFQENKFCMQESNGERSKVNEDIMYGLAKDLVDDSSPKDLIQFLAYSWFCDYNPMDAKKASQLDWSSLDDASRRHGLEIPRVTEGMLLRYLSINLGLSQEEHFRDLVRRCNAKLGCKFPYDPVADDTTASSHEETDDTAGTTGPGVPAQDVGNQTFIYGFSRMSPLYRPIFLAVLLWSAHMIASRLILPLMGYERWKSVRVDLSAVMQFYVLPPAKDSRLQNGKNEKPLLVLHGFGFGILPYLPLLLYLACKADRSRPIVVPEFAWLGLYPLGGIKLSELPATVGMAMTRNCRWVARQVRRMISGPAPVCELHSQDYFKKRPAPHMRGPLSRHSIVSIPGMPEVVDEVVSFMVFVRYHRIEEFDSKFMSRCRSKAPYLPYAEYRIHSYAKFWVDPLSEVENGSNLNLSPVSPSLKAAFLQSSTDAATAQQSRDQFLQKMLCRGHQLQVDSVLNWVSHRIRSSTVLDGTIYRKTEDLKERHERKERNRDLSFHVFAHSYGTALASCLLKSYAENVDQVILGDPICFMVQVTKKSQLVVKHPLNVRLFDRAYSHVTNPVQLLPHIPNMVFDRILICVYWYLVYRDFGTSWTCCRQLNGHEYLDESELLTKAINGKLLVVLGKNDLICPGRSINNFLISKTKGCNFVNENLIATEDHHGGFIIRPSILARLWDFLE